MQVILKKRQADNSFREIWSTVVDPASRFVNPAPVRPAGKVWSYLDNGPASQKVDLLVIGEGYTLANVRRLCQAIANETVRRGLDGKGVVIGPSTAR